MNSRDQIVLKKIIQYTDEISIDIIWETVIGDIPELKKFCESQIK